MAIGIALPTVCTLAVGVRYWTRYVQKAKLGHDDWLILAALVRAVTVPNAIGKELVLI
jgi:hypothetical protein